MYKIFGAMLKDLYCFGIDYVENLAANCRNLFIKRYEQTDNNIYAKCCADPFRLCGCIFYYCVRLISVCCIYSLIFCSVSDGEIKLYIFYRAVL